MRITDKTLSLLTLVALLAVPFSDAEARHQQVDRDDLDDEIVEEFPVPVLFGVNVDSVVPDFGDPRGGGTREHEGQDFRAPLGTPIVSPTEAIVIRTGTGASAGKYVYTANPGGETFRYMHLDYIADLDPGDELKVGDFIGTVGDTGNAPDGVYHLHFEVRDDDNDPTDPYDRVQDTFTTKEKMSFLRNIFRDIRDDEEYAKFLVSEFPSEFKEAIEKGYDLPRDIEEAVEDAGLDDEIEAQAELSDLLDAIPVALNLRLGNGDQGAAVQLIQIYLIVNSSGPARDRLAAATPTGYYGSITSEAMEEYQDKVGVAETGRYDSPTRLAMIDS